MFLKSFAKFTGKHLYQRLFFNKAAGVRTATLLKTRLWHKCFPVNFAKVLGTSFYRTPLVAVSDLSHILYWLSWYIIFILLDFVAPRLEMS